MVGQLIGKYRVVRKIGEGGMGSVFEAVHETIGRRAAVKVLRSMYSNEPSLVARFFNEARAVNVVQHPGIVGSFDYGQLDNGSAYIVMEYVDGESLAARLHRIPRLGEGALRLGRQIAAALAAAHEKGIVHRDLKPDNVIIVPDAEAPGGERARVLDFGIAKVAIDAFSGPPPAGSVAPVPTQTGVVMGTPRYMSPEQCKGAGNVDGKADVYSLGVVLYEMIAGRTPFTGEGAGALIAMHIYKEPLPLREAAPGTSAEVAQLVHKLLSKEPADRPTMAEVVGTLERLGARATGAAPVSSLSRVTLSPSHPSVSSAGFSAVSVAGPESATPSGMISGQAVLPPRTRFFRLAIPAALGSALVVVVLGSLAVQRVHHDRPALLDAPAPPKTAPATQRADAKLERITWQLDSAPQGARVVRLIDGTELGRTPLRLDRERQPGAEELALRLPGYKDAPLSLSREQNADRVVTLSLLAAAPSALPAAPSALFPPSRDFPAGRHVRPRPPDSRRDPRSPEAASVTQPDKNAKEPSNDDVRVDPVR